MNPDYSLRYRTSILGDPQTANIWSQSTRHKVSVSIDTKLATREKCERKQTSASYLREMTLVIVAIDWNQLSRA
jgi:hypothetical protein